MKKTILLVDGDDAALRELAPFFKDCSLIHCASYKEALVSLRRIDNCRVVIAEIGLHDECGTSFLQAVQKKHPRTVRMVLSGRTGFSDVCDALNRGHIYRYIAKPCDTKELVQHVRDALAHFDAESDQYQDMRSSLFGSVKALIDILDMVRPEAIGFAKRIRERVLTVGKALGVKPLWQLELAVMLSHIGCLALPTEVMEKVDQAVEMTPEEKQIFWMHPTIASSLLSNIPGMGPIAEIIGQQHFSFTDSQPMGARIIKVALDLDRWERRNRDPLAILNQMKAKAKNYDPRVVQVMQKLLTRKGSGDVRQLHVEELAEGMILAKDLVNKDGTKLLLSGQPISKASLIRLKQFHIALGIMDKVHVMAEKL